MKSLVLGLVTVLAVCSMGLAAIVPNTQYDGWRGFNNHDSGSSWMDSWGNHTDWGTSTLCDAAVAKFDRAAIQAAIDSNAVGGVYSADLHMAVTLGDAAALAIARPVAGVFAINAFPWGTATGLGTDFENAVTNNGNGNNMFDAAFPWSYDTLGDRYVLNLHVGQAMVDFYLTHLTADGFFISNANPDGTIDVGQRLEPPWGLGQATFTLEIVPEPATMAVLLVGGVAALIRRRR